MRNEYINQKILSLWKKYDGKSGKLYPLLFPEFKKNSILFIGLNPSFNKKEINKVNEGTDIQHIDFVKYCRKTNKNLNPNYLIKLEENAQKKPYPYFSKFSEIAKELDFATWEHIDLFFYRLTSQKEFKRVVEYKEDKNKIRFNNFNNFGEEQLKISLEIIKKINPKVIVVTNAFSSDIINKHSLFKFKIITKQFETLGYDFLDIDNKKIPIFFSSMVTGQRALDNHSLRRLKFDIKKTIINS